MPASTEPANRPVHLPPPTRPATPSADNFAAASGRPVNLIGAPMDRTDGRLKVTGGARYAAEFPLARLAHAVLVRARFSKGRVADIDAGRAEALPGVLAVITYKNCPRINPVPPTDPRSGSSQSPGVELQVQQDRIHYWGQFVAVVVAESLEVARQAAEMVKVDYVPEPAETDLEAAAAQGKLTEPRFKIKGKEDADTVRGDPETALEAAEVKIDQTYVTPTQNHNPMELHATTAVWEGAEGDRLTVYDATQGVTVCRTALATALGIPESTVRVICHYVGGGFGSKGGTWPHVILCAVAARVVGRPVRLMLTRQQMFTTPGRRSQTIQRVALGATREGKLTAIRHAVVCQTASYAEFVEAAGLPTRMVYACPNVAVSHRLAVLDTIVPTYMRAPGECPGLYALESAMDELAHALKMDPVELRLRNYADEDPQEHKPFSSKSLRECYRAAAEAFGWKDRNPEPRSMRDGNFLLGYGMATATYPMNRRPASARARVFADGTAIVQAASQDLGTGAYTVFTQVAAESLGLPPDKVRVQLGDTNFPKSGVSGGSSTTASVGSAVRMACDAVREKLIGMAVADAASPLHGLPADRVVAEEGRLADKGDRFRSEPFAAVLSRNKRSEVEATSESKAGDEQKNFSMHAFGAVFAAVRVDPDLGQVRVARVSAAYGAGRLLNAKTARSQFIGGLTFGIGMALLEETITDHRSGMIVNNNIADYMVPVCADVPEIQVIEVPEDDPHVNPIGVKGIGEIGIVGAPAAIANAVFHATGKRVRDLPITTDKLL